MKTCAEGIGGGTDQRIQFHQFGVDGVFSDFADTAFAGRIMFKLLKDADYAKCLVRGDCDNR